MKTIGAILEQLNKPLVIAELHTPSLKPGQVLVELAYSGVCRSQLNEIQGFKGKDAHLPHTLGHEGSGIVLEVGEGVTKVKPGDFVVLTWIQGAGLNVSSCQYKDANGTPVNSGAISTFLHHAVVSENRLIPIPKEMPLREAALFGCAVPTGAGAVLNQMNIQPGQSLAIFGLGGIGTSALLAARYRQAFPLIAIDIHEEKLAKAKELGATHCIHLPSTDTIAAIHSWTHGQGVDFAIECAGKKESMQLAFRALKAPNGLCILVGNLPKGQSIQIDPFDLILGKKIIGTWGGSSQMDKDVAHYASLHLQQAVRFDSLITHEISLDEINPLLQELEQGRVGRGLIKF